MGTKGGKPLSVIEKRQKKIEKKKEEKKEVKEEKKERIGGVDQSMVKKVIEDLKTQHYLTTFQVVQKYGIRYSMAKKILKAVVAQGNAEIVEKNRRVILVSSRKQ